MGYYETDSRRISFAEYWRLAPLGVPLSWTMKLLGMRLDFGYAIPYPTRIVRLAPEDVPPEHSARLGPMIADCERLGLRFRFFYTEPAVSPGSTTTGAVTLSDDGHTMALMIHSEYAPRRLVQSVLGFVTRLEGGASVETTTSKKTFEDQPGADVARFPGADASELLSRHRERVRRRGGTIEPIAENELEDLLAAESDDANRHRIERGVLVPCPPEKLERLRAGETGVPTPSPFFSAATLRSLALWTASLFVIVILWNFFHSSRERGSERYSAIDDLISPTPRLSLSCGDLPDAPIRPEGPAAGHGFTVAGVFADTDAAALASAQPAAAAGVDVVRLGPVLFLRRAGAEGVDETSWRPIVDLLEALGARALVEAPAWEKSLSAGLLWRLDDEEAADEIEEALTAYFAAPYFFVLRAPWAPPDVGTSLTEAQQRARRHYLALTRHAERPDRAYVRRYVEAAQGRDPQALKELMEEQQRRHVERQRRVVESLEQEYPDLDPELVDRYLDHIDTPVPEIAEPGDAAYQRRVAERIGEQYRRGAALGELMGQLAHRWPETAGRPPEVVDPARAYSAWAPDVGRQEVVFRLDMLVFEDVAVGLPALLDHLCSVGADDLVLTLDDYDDVRGD